MTMADSEHERGKERTAAATPATVPGGSVTSSEDVGRDEATPRGCPFLVADGGGWRLDLPTREHRCAAVSPPAPLSPEKQSRLCLTPAHTACATYLASIAARQVRLGSVPADRTTRWGLARTTTVIEDPGGWSVRILALLLDRRRWPAIPAVLLVTTLFTLALSGLRAGGSNPASATAGASGTQAAPALTSTPSTAPTSTFDSVTPTEAPPTEAPSAAAPSPTAKSTPVPDATFRTYKVKEGDSLSAIAAKYNTTSRDIARLNNISVATPLHIGQVLKIPN
ncbi:MAG TPA: LysM peptidoglycan-binding domain-containing protein [Candidatus Limnocylindrales bacterium]